VKASRLAALLAVLAAWASASGCDSTAEAPSAPAAPPLETAELGALASCFRCGDVHLGSRPDGPALELAARRGFARIVDVRLRREVSAAPLASEARRYGLVFEQIVTDPPPRADGSVDPNELTDAAVDQVIAALELDHDGPVLVFCETGSRAAAFFAVYRSAVHGLDVEEALAEARAAGMKPGAPELEVRRQVERLRPSTAAPAQATNASTTSPSSTASRQDGGNA
jgi:uncharacterized protein (TIGR01244 family)